MSTTTATVRMYNQQNLGDCFLLKFSNGNKNSWVLIDLGSYKGKNAEQEIKIAGNIKETLNGEPVNIVLTHQHKDHLSGFITAADVFKDMEVPELWLSFLDDQDSEEGKAVRDVSTKYWQKSDKLNKLVSDKFGMKPEIKSMLKAKEGLDIFAEGQTGGEAITNLTSWAKETKFFTPGDNFDLPGLEGEVKVYVLGPPTDFNMLKSMDPKAGEAVDGLAALNEIDTTSSFLLNALDPDGPNTQGKNENNGFPFSNKYTVPLSSGNKNPAGNEEDLMNFNEFISKHPSHRKSDKSNKSPREIYNDKGADWRKIDCDWLGDMGRLALYMDNLTNNTSLVLAFEIVETGKVLLFVGDAQIGNWKSWFDIKFKDSTVTAEDLLTRTVLYKAGHHSSHNATYKKGLDLMNEKELVIMVPLNQEISDAYHFLMGKPEMLAGYNRKSHGRMVRTDTIFQDASELKDLKFPFVSEVSDIRGMELFPDNASQPDNPQLYIEYTVQ